MPPKAKAKGKGRKEPAPSPKGKAAIEKSPSAAQGVFSQAAAAVAAVVPRAVGLLEAMRLRGTLPVSGIGSLTTASPSAATPTVAVSEPQRQPGNMQAAGAPTLAASPPTKVPKKRPRDADNGSPPPESKAARTATKPSPQSAPPGPPEQRIGGGPLAKTPGKRPPVPAVPAFRTLKQIKLPPRVPDDNYEISEKGEESEDEEPDRSSKHVPTWSKNYLELLKRQGNTDPDTIFGSRVPAVELDLIFRDQDYLQMQTEKPKRRRGSSGEWKQDRLSKVEVSEYKKRMGQVRHWSTDAAGQPASLGA